MMIFFKNKYFFTLFFLICFFSFPVFSLENEDTSITIFENGIKEKKTSTVPFYYKKNKNSVEKGNIISVDENSKNGIIFDKSNEIEYACFMFPKENVFLEKQLEVAFDFQGELPYSINAYYFYDEDKIVLSQKEEDNVSVCQLIDSKYGVRMRFPFLQKENKNPVGVIIWCSWKKDAADKIVNLDKVDSVDKNQNYVKIKSFSVESKMYGWSIPFLCGEEQSSFYGFETFGKKYLEVPNIFDFSKLNNLNSKNEKQNEKQNEKTKKEKKDNFQIFNIDFGIAAAGLKMRSDNKYGVLPEVYFSNTNKKITFYPYHKKYYSKIKTSYFVNAISKIEIKDVGNYIFELLIEPQETEEKKQLKNKDDSTYEIYLPISIDPGLIVEYPKTIWRNENYEIFSWDRFPSVLIMDTANYSFQSKMFNRIACFVEKNDSFGRILSDKEMEAATGFLAHDYNAESLSNFFSEASKQKINLTDEENLLKEILLAHNIIVKIGKDLFLAGEGAIVSISRESELYRRRLFVTHECSHGLFFIDDDFKTFVSDAYLNSPEKLKEFLKVYYTFSDNLQYDTNNLLLMENEFMAYMLQLPCDKTLDHFAGYIASRMEEKEELLPFVEYIKTEGQADLANESNKLSDYLYMRWGLGAGRVNMLIFNSQEN